MCKHESFACSVEVVRITNDAGDVERFQANIRVICDECKTVFRFLGLPAGLDLNGASASLDGAEARLMVAPKGEVVSPLEGAPHGFSVRRSSRIEEDLLRVALEESVKLQSHYAKLLNGYDRGQRIGFANASEWIARLKETGKLTG